MIRQVAIGMVLIFGAVAGPASASSITLDATSRGSYRSAGVFGTGGAGTPTGNYFTGKLGATGTEYRSFFVFDLTGLSGPVVSASMSFALSDLIDPGCLPAGTCAYDSVDPFETLSLFDFTGSIAALSSNTGGVAAFADLGSGTVLGTLTLTPASSGTVTLALNSSGLAAINAALGGSFAFGGAVTSLSGAADEAVFGDSGGRLAELTLVTGTSSVPEPASLLLLGTGLAAVVARRRFSKRK